MKDYCFLDIKHEIVVYIIIKFININIKSVY